MTSNKPYFIRAIYEWICDNNLTPYIVVSVSDPTVIVPKQYVEDGKIILNISPAAAHAMLMDNEKIEFMARFSGVAMKVYTPIKSVMAIYARENSQGMIFNEEPGDGSNDGGDNGGNPPPSTGKKGKPQLRVVK